MYKRVLLKLSGETLSGEGGKGFSEKMFTYLVSEIKKIHSLNIKLGIVIGAGNIFRGKELKNFQIQMADQLGMLGTVINSLYLKNVFEKDGLKSIVVSPIVNLPSVMPLKYDFIEQCFEAGYIVLFGGGTSNPLFTTDTAAALRAIEMNADIKVDGIYDKDPKLFENAKKYDNITYEQAIKEQIKVMDTEAFSICEKNNLSILIINFFKEGNLLKAVEGENIGTKVNR